MYPRKFAAALLAALTLLATQVVMAQEKKEPLTLKRIGKNIGRETTRAGKNIGKESKRLYRNGEYGLRKGGENVSQTSHRVVGTNSTVRDRGRKKTEVVKPDGTHIPVTKKANH